MDGPNLIRSCIFLVASLSCLLIPEKVWKFSFLKNEIIVKSPKLNAEEKEKIYKIFLFIKGKIILKKFISFNLKDNFISL